MIAGAYGSDEWHCAGEASYWSCPIFDELHINCAIQYTLAFRSKKGVWRFFCGFSSYVTKLANRGGLSWKPVEARRNSVATCPFFS
jgi:hypothetical protein